MASSGVTYRWQTASEGLANLPAAWAQLVARSGGPATAFHRWEWVAAAATYPENTVAFVTATGPTGELLAAVPVHAERDAGNAVLYPIRLVGATPHLSNAFPASMVWLWPTTGDGPVLDAAAVVAMALRRLRAPAFYLMGPPPALRAQVEVAAPRAGWRCYAGEASTEAWIDFPDGPEAYLAQRSSKFRQNQRRARRDLEALGPQGLFEARRAGWPWAQAAEALREAFSRCWQVNSPESPLYRTRQEATLAAFGQLYAADLLEVYFYRLGEVHIAFEVGLTQAPVYYPLVRGHDKQHHRQSPGNLLAEATLHDLFPRGVRHLYLGAIHLSATTQYKAHWMNREAKVDNLLVVRRASFYGVVDALYRRVPLFHKLWWKLKLGERLRRRFAVANATATPAPSATE